MNLMRNTFQISYKMMYNYFSNCVRTIIKLKYFNSIFLIQVKGWSSPNANDLALRAMF